MGSYTQKLANMRGRRLGLGTSGLLATASLGRALDSTSFSEAYESRSKSEATKYALGAMQALEPSYTQVSIQEGERVRNQLDTDLYKAGIPVTFEYQGSVPLDIHIRFASDIDLLVLHDKFVTLDWSGPTASTYSSHSHAKGSLIDDMMHLRRQCEEILKNRFPAATVDKSGAKSISLSGGSLKRKVDVVPSHWHDTSAYQISKEKHDREVRILHRDQQSMITNRPFLHIKRINEKDSVTNGGAKKVIRLLKNIKQDSARDIRLTSYDIASLVWHFDSVAMTKPYYLELSLVAETQRHLQVIADNPEWAKTLDVPDRSRKIIDSSEKLVALQGLKLEVDQLASDIARELNPQTDFSGYDMVRKSLNETYVL